MSSRGCGALVLGAVIAPVVVLTLAFLHGATRGAGTLMSSGGGHTYYGLEGGRAAIANLSFVYEITFGLVPLAISAVGAALSLAVSRLLRPKAPEKIAPLLAGAFVALGYALWRPQFIYAAWNWSFQGWTLLLTGPLSALLAGALAQRYPRAGAARFLIGALCSAGLVVTSGTGHGIVRLQEGVVALALVPFPMLAIGAWLLLAGRKGAPPS